MQQAVAFSAFSFTPNDNSQYQITLTVTPMMTVEACVDQPDDHGRQRESGTEHRIGQQRPCGRHAD
ncbi:MAG: hypothetical protein H6823_18885 [Planctomycetaceae bacterium]|nr:hypothetical protein [Planctomycetaceae bacterium]